MFFNCNKNSLILFNKDKNYNGFIVKRSDSEYTRRALTWFYRNVKIPSLKSWELFLSIFNLVEMPIQVLQLYDKNNVPTNKYIIIYDINQEYIEYSFDGKHILYPITICSLIPEYYVYNITCL
jgi:hypothetical protein